MRTLRQLSSIGATAVITSAITLAACQGVVDDGNDGPGNNGGSGGDMNRPGDGGGDPRVCVPGIPATSQVPRLLNREYDAVIRDMLDITSIGGQPPSALLNPDFDGAMNAYAWNAYLDAADKIAAEVMAGPSRSRFIDCDPAQAGCLEETIRKFGRKAFRRPVTDTEVASFMRLNNLEPAGTPDEVAEAILYAFLASPSFLMRLELNDEPEGQVLKLSPHEVASRLSFLLWGSAPDDVLNAAADAGELETKEQILAQAQRMLQDRAKTGPLVAQAHRAYLGMDGSIPHWWNHVHDTDKFPQYSEAAIPAMQAELDLFFEEVAFGGGSFRDLFLSNVAYVNQQTAALYGLDPSAYGADLQRVELNAEERPGFLTRVGFLSSFSSYDTTSPILRGAFITGHVIGVDPGAPDPEALKVPLPEGDFQTQREVIDELTSPPGCATCHRRIINPPGYVLEWYDSVGGWQTTDPLGGPIDGTAEVIFGPDTVETITSPRELMERIGDGPLASRMYAERLVAFANQRRPNSNDACVVDELDAKLSQDGYTVLNLLADLTQADSFRLRAVGN